MSNFVLPRRSMVVLIGASGSGKSTFARRHFLRTQVVSSDECRGLVCDNPESYECSADAFALLFFLVKTRLKLSCTTVIDSTAVEWMTRETLIQLADDAGFRKVAIVFEIPEDVCVCRDATRPKPVGPNVIQKQKGLLAETLRGIESEGWDEILWLNQDNQAKVRLAIA